MSQITESPQDSALDRPIRAQARACPPGPSGPMHCHAFGELLYAESGTLKVTTEVGSWLVPPSRAAWIPPQTPHQATALNAVEMHTVFLRADACPADAPKKATLLVVSPLLRELIRAAALMPAEYDEQGRDGRAVVLLLEEICWSPLAGLVMPVLRDARLLAMERALTADPGNVRSLEDWADEVGASARTLARLFQREAGMTFHHWRELLRVQVSTTHLQQGVLISSLAYKLGYETPSAFTAMFRRVMGMTPTEYITRGARGALDTDSERSL